MTTAFVTGAGGGIGRAVSLRFASAGSAVTVVDIDPGGGEETRVHETSRDDWQRILDVNLTGIWNCMRYQIPVDARGGRRRDRQHLVSCRAHRHA
jgi:NAD(P)-dependent dehydrogenase (short-subunit alcohol dehydrogenase family)